MSLRKNDEDKQVEYKGSGFVRQEEDGSLAFKLYSNEAVAPRDFFEPSTLSAGELIPDKEFFSLTATDVTYRTWQAERILIDQNVGAGTVFSGSLYEMTCRQPAPRESSGKCNMTLWFLGRYKLPCNAASRPGHRPERQGLGDISAILGSHLGTRG